MEPVFRGTHVRLPFTHQAVHETGLRRPYRHGICQQALNHANPDHIIADKFHADFSVNGFQQPHDGIRSSQPHPDRDKILGKGIIGSPIENCNKESPDAYGGANNAQHQEITGYCKTFTSNPVQNKQPQAQSRKYHLGIHFHPDRQVEREQEQACYQTDKQYCYCLFHLR